MTFSPLISGTLPHHNKFSNRNGQPIMRVLQHHHAASSLAGVERLTNPAQQASSNYIIMSSGEILGQVPEEYRAWTSGSFEADAPSITIEVQNCGGQVNGNDSDPASWPITDAAYSAIVHLVADIAKRYGWGGVGASNYRGHREFSQTACPGGYLWSRMGNIRAAANNAYGSAAGGDIIPQGTITPQEDELSAEDVGQINTFTQAELQKERATIVAEVRANATATVNAVAAMLEQHAHSIKLFDQSTDNENADRIIHDFRDQLKASVEKFEKEREVSNG